MILDGFLKRQKAAQAGFVRSAELGFRVIMLRNRKLGVWAAEIMGFKGAEALAYIDKLIEVSIIDNRKDAVFEKLLDDFDVSNVDITDRSLQRKMEELFNEANDEAKG